MNPLFVEKKTKIVLLKLQKTTFKKFDVIIKQIV